MLPVYSIDTLKCRSLVELKAITLQLGVTAADKRVKQSWVEAIVVKQPQKVEPVLFDVDGDKVLVDGEAIASINPDENLTQPWKVEVGGVEIHRAATWAQCFSYVCWHYRQGTLPIATVDDDYLFHGDSQPVEQPVNLPRIGDTHLVGNFLLRCIQVGGSYATVWDVCDSGIPLGEICMGWDCFWIHNLSLETFATPQEAMVSLYEFARELIAA